MTVASFYLHVAVLEPTPPLLHLDTGMNITYTPNRSISIPGIILSRTTTTFSHPNPTPNDPQTTLTGFHVAFHLLLQLPPHLSTTPPIDPTHYPIIVRSNPWNISYPTWHDFYDEPSMRTLPNVSLWFDSWKWWYMTRRVYRDIGRRNAIAEV